MKNLEQSKAGETSNDFSFVDKCAELWYLKRASPDNNDAYFELGNLYNKYGQTERAINCYLESAKLSNYLAIAKLESLDSEGNLRASNALAEIDERSGRWGEARGRYEKNASKGDKDAMLRLGILFEEDRLQNGKIVISQDLKKAFSWFRKSAVIEYQLNEQNGTVNFHNQALNEILKHALTNSHAAYCVAEMFELGEGCVPDMGNAIMMYERSSELGLDAAPFRLGTIYESNPMQSFKYYLLALERNHKDALAACEKIIKNTNNPEFEYQLGNLYSDKAIPYEAIKWFVSAAKKNHVLSEYRVKPTVLMGDEYLYAIGCLFESDANGPSNLARAFECYLFCIRSKNVSDRVLRHVTLMAENGNPEAQYILGCEYYFSRIKDRLQSIQWCIQAADQNHEKSIKFINETHFSADEYYTIAKMYNDGKFANKNPSRALEFFIKASDKGSVEAIYSLGEYYEAETPDHKADLEKSCGYYLKAAESLHPGSLTNLERIFNTTKDPNPAYKLATIYANKWKKINEALIWYKRAADLDHKDSADALSALISRNSEHAFFVGQLYENEEGSEDSLAKALEFYIKSACSDNHKALERLRNIANKKNSQAQYLLGYRYYALHKKDNRNAIELCLQAAELNHEEARQYIMNTKFNADDTFYMAQLYEKGELISQNSEKALKHYLDAADMEHVEATYRLGQVYEEGLLGVEKNSQTAQSYYLKSAKKSHSASLEILESVSSVTADPVFEYELGEVYHTSDNFLKRKYGAKHYEKSVRLGHEPAWTRLSTLMVTDEACAYTLGQLYEERYNASQVQKDLELACDCYGHALFFHHSSGRSRLQELASQNIPYAQYKLAGYYCYSNNHREEAAKLYLKVSRHYPVAEFYLSTLEFNHETYLMISEAYATGKDVEVDREKSFEFLTKASSNGNSKASSIIADFYETGKHGFEKDINKAFNYYILSATQNNGRKRNVDSSIKSAIELAEKYPSPDKYYKLGECYENSLFDTSQAIDWYRKAALMKHKDSIDSLKRIEGHASAQLALASRYYYPRVELSKAAEPLMKPADQYHTDAKVCLSSHSVSQDVYTKISNDYEKGNGVRADFSLSKEFYKKAEGPDSLTSEAVALMPVIFRDSTSMKQYINLLDRALAQDPKFVPALLAYKLTIINFAHRESIRKKIAAESYYSVDIAWFDKNGTPGACYLKANYYQIHRYNEEDCYSLYSRASREGILPASYSLGDIYYDPSNIKKQAIEYYRMGDQGGYPLATSALAYCYHYAEDELKDDAEAIRCAERALKCGDDNAMYILGLIYLYSKRFHEPEKGKQLLLDYIASLERDIRQYGNGRHSEGIPLAQYSVAEYYWRARGTTNYYEGIKWAEKAIDHQFCPDVTRDSSKQLIVKIKSALADTSSYSYSQSSSRRAGGAYDSDGVPFYVKDVSVRPSVYGRNG